MDTSSEIMTDQDHVCTQKELMRLLQKIFDESFLETRDISALKGATLVGTVDVDIKQRKGRWSDELYGFLGLEPGEVEGDHELFLSYVKEEDRQELRAMINEDFDGLSGDNYSLFRIRTGEGTVASILGLTELTTDHLGRPEFMYVKMFDVSKIVGVNTHKEHLTNYLSSKWVNRIFDNKVTGIFILNEKGEFLRTNQTYQKLTGYTGEELKRLTFLDVTLQEEQEPCLEKMSKLLSGEMEFFSFEKRVKNKSGELRWVEVNCTVVDEESFYVLCFVTDVHDKKIMKKKFLASEEQLHEAQKIAKIGSWETDLKTGQISWSKGMYDLMEVSCDFEPDEQSVLHFIHPEDLKLFKHEINRSKSHNGYDLKDLEIRHVVPGGVKYILINSKLEIDEDGTPVRYYGTSQDISERRFEDKRHELVQSTAKLGWWESNLLNDEEDVWSDYVYEILELNKATTKPCFETFQEKIHPDDKQMIADSMADPDCLKNSWHNRVTRVLRADGTYKYILDSGYFVWDGDRPVRLIGTMMDISETKVMQSRVEQAQKLAKVGWWEFDMTGHGSNRYSTEHMEIMGIDHVSELATLEDFYRFVHPDDLKYVKETQEKAILAGGWTNMAHRIITRSGEVRHITSNATISFKGDEPVRLFGSVYDITVLKEAEWKLSKNLVNLEAMINSMDNMVLLIDDQLICQEVFCKGPHMLGTDVRTITGKHMHEVLEGFQELMKANRVETEYIHDIYQELLKGEVVEPISFKLGSEPETRWWEAQFHTFKGQDDRIRIAIAINNITARKKAEEELVKSVQKEKELSEMRSQFVSMASHQFRTPLTVIKANMQLLELADIKDPLIEKVTRRLDTEVDRLVNLMQDVLAMGKVQSNTVKPNFKEVSLQDLVEKIKREVENQYMDNRSLQVSTVGEPKPVKLDEQFMEHALHNLIDNALKYSPGAADPEITITYREEKVLVSVLDHGIGIPETDQPRLFNSFQRGSNSQHIQGTGLGLAIAKEFIRLNHGAIYLNKRRKEGTEFCIDLLVKA